MQFRIRAVMACAVLVYATAVAITSTAAAHEDVTPAGDSVSPDAWFTTTRVGEGIWRIEDNGQAHIYVVEGETAALVVDTGMGYIDARSYVATLTDKPLLVVNTHGHPDHAGGNRAFERVHVHPAERGALAYYTSDAVLDDTYRRFLGMPMPDRLRRPGGGEAELVPVEDGATFDLGNRTLDVIHIPGHSPGSIALYDRNTHGLFTGDSANQHLWLQVPYVTSVEDFLASIIRLQDYPAPVERLYPGHGPVLEPSRLGELRAAAEHFLSGQCAQSPYDSPLGPFHACEHAGVVLVYPLSAEDE